MGLRQRRICGGFTSALVVVAVMAMPSNAATIISNGSFELGPAPKQPSQGFDQYLGGSTEITSWLVTGQGINLIFTFWQASNGSRSLDLNDTAAGGVQQTLATVL